MHDRRSALAALFALLPAYAFCCGLLTGALPALAEDSASRLYRVIEGRADARTYNGYRRYNASCNHCHGPDGIGATIGPSLIANAPEPASFRDAVLFGRSRGNSVMGGFVGDPNITPYVDDILAYLQARADGALDRGRPPRLD